MIKLHNNNNRIGLSGLPHVFMYTTHPLFLCTRQSNDAFCLLPINLAVLCRSAVRLRQKADHIIDTHLQAPLDDVDHVLVQLHVLDQQRLPLRVERQPVGSSCSCGVRGASRPSVIGREKCIKNTTWVAEMRNAKCDMRNAKCEMRNHFAHVVLFVKVLTVWMASHALAVMRYVVNGRTSYRVSLICRT